MMQNLVATKKENTILPLQTNHRVRPVVGLSVAEGGCKIQSGCPLCFACQDGELE